jgi:hypothetical protein
MIDCLLPFSVYKTIKKDDKPIISAPSNFEHTVHVGFDPTTGEFTVRQVLKKIVLKKNAYI